VVGSGRGPAGVASERWAGSFHGCAGAVGDAGHAGPDRVVGWGRGCWRGAPLRGWLTAGQRFTCIGRAGQWRSWWAGGSQRGRWRWRTMTGTDADLFVGGRVVGGQYPAGASSRLYRQRGNWSWTRERRGWGGGWSRAVWSDWRGRVAGAGAGCEWGPVRVFQNERGQLREMTQGLGLSGQTAGGTG